MFMANLRNALIKRLEIRLPINIATCPVIPFVALAANLFDHPFQRRMEETTAGLCGFFAATTSWSFNTGSRGRPVSLSTSLRST